MSAEIKIKNVRAITSLRIPLPDGGGVVVFRGGHGVGKSTAVAAVDALATGRGADALQPTDGCAQGLVEGCGIRLSIGKRTNRTGELVVTSIDGKLSIADLVDPGIIDPDRADAKRIKSLIQLAGSGASPDTFVELFDSPERFNEVVPPSAVQADDVLVMAEMVKAAIEKAARKHEGQSATEMALAASCQEAMNGVDINAECDSAKLQRLLEEAIRDEQKILTDRHNATEHNARVAEAQSQFQAGAVDAASEQVEAARLAMQDANDSLVIASKEVRRIAEELEKARNTELGAAAAAAAADTNLNEKIANLNRLLKVKETIDSVGNTVEVPSDADIQSKTLAVEAARLAVEAGVVVRNAKKKERERQEHIAKATENSRAADSLRDKAAAVDTVLSGLIAKLGSCPLRVEAGRLRLTTDRGSELYADLSEGERWLIAIDIAIDKVGSGGIVTIPQAAWEGLNKKTRNMIATHCRERGSVAVTAEVTDDEELSAGLFQE